MPSRRRVLRVAAGASTAALAGCLARTGRERDQDTTTTTATTTTASTTTTPTMTPFPDGSVLLPDGPKEPPERPDELTAVTVEGYVRTYEYRYVYNRLYRSNVKRIEVSAGVSEVVETPVGFAVGVQARGWTNYGGTTTVHADFGGHLITYLVDEDSTVRVQGRPDDHV